MSKANTTEITPNQIAVCKAVAAGADTITKIAARLKIGYHAARVRVTALAMEGGPGLLEFYAPDLAQRQAEVEAGKAKAHRGRTPHTLGLTAAGKKAAK